MDALVEAVEGLSFFSESAAGRFVRNVIATVDRLERFPALGRVVPEYGRPELREVFVGRYRLVYRLHGAGDQVQIALLWPSAIPIDE